MKTHDYSSMNPAGQGKGLGKMLSIPTGVYVFLGLVFLCSCAKKPSDMRSFVPADSLVYLETNDLGAAIGPVINNEAFANIKNRPDVSAVNGVQLAITVSGFELNEEKLTSEHSVARVQPTFVAIVDTHAWNWQAVAFADQKIGEFVMGIYHSDVTEERGDKYGGNYFTWAAPDGRRAHALVTGSLVYFSNNEAALEKCLSVVRGEVDSLAAAGKVSQTQESAIASGYISPDGVAQLANVVGLLSASEIGEAAEVQSIIAGILPRLLRGAVNELRWTLNHPKDMREAGRMEDSYSITPPPQIARVLSETLSASGVGNRALFDNVPADIPSVTYYDLAKPHIAWRGVLLTAQTLTDQPTGALIAQFSDSFAEPYAVRDPELYLSGVSPAILTGNIDPGGEKPFVISTVTVPENVRRSLASDLKPDKPLSDELAVELLRSEDGDLAAAFFDGKVISGQTDAVIACLRSHASGESLAKSPAIVALILAGGTASSLSADKEIGPAIAASVFESDAARQVHFNSVYLTETRFSGSAIERRTVSDFGLIGSIIANLGGER
jgi:hypothetical protein